MPTTVTVRVDGLRELGDKMRKLSEKMNKSDAASATGAAGKVVKTKAIRNIQSKSVDTGLLADHVIVKKIPKSQTTLTSEHIVTVKKAQYPEDNPDGQRDTRHTAGWLEFGTIEMDAEPWLRPAFNTEQGKAKDVMVERLAKRIDEATR